MTVKRARLKAAAVKVEPSPHNRHKPLNLRKYPVCYLCGGSWWGKTIDLHRNSTAECSDCELQTFVTYDAAVFEARGWQ